MWRLVLTCGLLCWRSEGKVTCRDENNGEKDWYILYKAPKQNALTGLEYIYINSTGVKKMGGAPVSNYKPINHPEGILANTLRPLFTPIRSMSPNFGFISYSDQPPGCSAANRFGHSKGVLMVDKTGTGVWLLHSTPNFPNERDQNNFWPKTGEKNAQTFICVTFPYDQFRHIGTHLKYIGAFPFDKDIPEDFHQELLDIVNMVSVMPSYQFQLLSSSAGFQFQSIAKTLMSDADDGDLYVTITERVDSDLLVQTWGCQSLRSPSFCEVNKHKVENIKTIRTALGNWKTTVDHSKWCVATGQTKHWTCFADVNRAQSQYKRRVGALCIDNREIKDTFMSYVGDIEKCNHKDITDILDCHPHSGSHTDVTWG